MSRRASEDRFDRYTDRAQEVIAFAHDCARRVLRHPSIDTEHLLLGITDAGDGVASMALAALNVSLSTVRIETLSQLTTGQAAGAEPIPFTATASSVLERAEREADTLGNQQVGTGHLLLALATETGSRAAQVLARLGLTQDRLRVAVLRSNAYTRERPTGDEPAPEHVVGGRRFALPAELVATNTDLAEARWQKELAVDAQDWEAAAAWRSEEKRRRDTKRELVNSWVASIGTEALVDEIDRLYRQAERAHDLLHEHGITITPTDPDATSRRTRERHPAPIATPSIAEPSTDTPDDHANSDEQIHTDATPPDAVVHPQPPLVNIRGWLEGDRDQIALVRQSISNTLDQDPWWFSFGWRFPQVQVSRHRYAFYGLHVHAGFHAFVDWFLNQLRNLAELPPDTAGSQLGGLFLATHPDGQTIQWLITNRQVVTVPGDPYQQPPET